MGSAVGKKAAQDKCYLDVAQYLESSDPPLWRDFALAVPFSTGADAKTPHVLFKLSEELADDIRDLCKNIKTSEIFERSNAVVVAQKAPAPVSAGSSYSTNASPALLDAKSQRLLERLEAYDSDPKMAKMRAQRASLPVSARASELLAKFESNEVTVCLAATGSGKTTQIPQIILDDYIRRGDGAKCNVLCTQPRRLAATSVAERVAAERGERIGESIGYQVRFEAKFPQPNGNVMFVTTGIFLKRLQHALSGEDKEATAWLNSLTHILIDEVHERDIDTDLLLVVVKRLVKDRREKKLPVHIILMSATVDPTLFQEYFKDPSGRLAPIAEAPGRSFPVERHYLDELLPKLQNLPHNQGGWVFNDRETIRFLDQEKKVASGFEMTKDVLEGGEKTPAALTALMIAHICKTSDEGHIVRLDNFYLAHLFFLSSLTRVAC
jgi:HrpA-like RNA helicase